MKIVIVLLTLCCIVSFGENAFASNDGRPVGNVYSLAHAIGKKCPAKYKKNGVPDKSKLDKWIIGRSFKGKSTVIKSKKADSNMCSVPSCLVVGYSGILTNDARKTYDLLGAREYIVSVTYKKVDGRLRCEVKKMWPVKK